MGGAKIVVGRYDPRMLKYSGAKVSLGVCRTSEGVSEVEGERKRREKKVEMDELCVRGAARRAAPRWTS